MQIVTLRVQLDVDNLTSVLLTPWRRTRPMHDGGGGAVSVLALVVAALAPDRR